MASLLNGASQEMQKRPRNSIHLAPDFSGKTSLQDYQRAVRRFTARKTYPRMKIKLRNI